MAPLFSRKSVIPLSLGVFALLFGFASEVFAAPPATTSPTNDTTPTWSWTVYTDTGGSGLSGYTVQWCGDGAFPASCDSNTASVSSPAVTNPPTTIVLFSHTTALTQGTWYLRVKAGDNATNESAWSANGSVVIDITAPTVTSFTINGTSCSGGPPCTATITTNAAITIEWSSTDTGGSLLKHSEVWVGIDTDTDGNPDSWSQIDGDPNTAGTNPAVSPFTHDPVDGTYWYGLHIKDNALNCITEDTSGTDKGHCDGVITSDGLDTRTDRGPIKVVMARNSAPVANAQAVSTNEDRAAIITLAGSDTETCNLTFTNTNPSNGTLSAITNVACASGAPNTDTATVTYTPSANYSGNDSFTFTVTDGSSATSTATVSITVTAVNDAPVLATNSTLAYTENDVATAINTAITVSDVDNATLASGTVTISVNYASNQDVLVFTNASTMGNIAGVWTVANGKMTLTSAGATATLAQWQAALRAVTYVNSSDAPSTSARTVAYAVNDGTANSNVINSTINVTAVNDAPVALSQSNGMVEDGGSLQFILEGFDVEDAQLTFTIVAGPSSGSLGSQYSVRDTNNILIRNKVGVDYTPSSNFNGSDPFTFKVNDGAVDSNVATVSITVTAVNDAPVLATNSTLAYTENDAATAINTAITVSDVDNATLASGTVTISVNYASNQDVLVFTNASTMGNIAGVWTVANGKMTLTSTGSTATLANWQAALRAVTYVNSSDNPSTSARTVAYVVNDGAVNSNTVNSTINVTAVNDAPIAVGDSYAMIEGTTFSAVAPGILANDTDIEGDALTAVLGNTVSNGALTLNANGSFTYTPNSQFVGNDAFTYKAKDAGNAESSPATVTITVADDVCIPPLSGDWEIKTNCVVTSRNFTMQGNLSIRKDGTLDMRGTTNIVFDKSVARYIYIDPGGQLFQDDTAGFNKP